jgi:cytochrome c553
MLHYYDDAGNRVKTAWRNVCSKCHENRMAERNNTTYTKLKHRWHSYLWSRKDYCENQDGRLGFVCNTVLPTPEMIAAAGLNWTPEQFLEVDHIDGRSKRTDGIDPDRPENLQTLCHHCHKIKGIQNGDHLTPGRKTYKFSV